MSKRKKKSIIGLILNITAAILCFICALKGLIDGDAFDFWVFFFMCVGNIVMVGC